MGWKDINTIIKYNENNNNPPSVEEQVEDNTKNVDLGKTPVCRKVSWADVVKGNKPREQQMNKAKQN